MNTATLAAPAQQLTASQAVSRLIGILHTTGFESAIVEARALLHQVAPITDADIAAFFRAKAEASGIPDISIGYCNSYHRNFHAQLADCTSHTVFGDTIDEAISGLRVIMKTPWQLAEEKREAARKLMAEADAIAPA